MERVQVVKLVIVVMAAFFLCWSPHQILMYYAIFFTESKVTCTKYCFFSRPTPIGGREIHIGWIREEGGGGGMRTLSSTNRKPDSPRARPGHRAVSIRMDCVLVSVFMVTWSQNELSESLTQIESDLFHLISMT